MRLAQKKEDVSVVAREAGELDVPVWCFWLKYEMSHCLFTMKKSSVWDGKEEDKREEYREVEHVGWKLCERHKSGDLILDLHEGKAGFRGMRKTQKEAQIKRSRDKLESCVVAENKTGTEADSVRGRRCWSPAR